MHPRATKAALLKLPIAFEPNGGRTDKRARFIARGPGYGLWLTRDGNVLRAGRELVRTRLADSRATRVAGEARQPGVVNSYVGKTHVTGLPIYGRVRYDGVYPGTDLVYYGRAGRLEYDFRLRPGADPRRIALDVRGAARIRVDSAGDLVIGHLKQLRPVAFQMRHGVKRRVEARYRVDGHRVRFDVGTYDRSRPLVIDPVLAFSTFLGGSAAEYAQAVAVDSSGNAYFAGSTSSGNFPTVHPGQAGNNGGRDVFITEIAPDGAALVFSTYLGGAAEDFAYGIALQPGGSGIFVTGHTFSNDFVTTDGSSLNGTQDGFVTKLNGGSFGALVYSIDVGGATGTNKFTEGLAIAADSTGNAYVAGYTTTSDFPTTAGAAQTTTGGGADGWVMELGAGADAQHPAHTYSSYLGGGGDDIANGIAINGSLNAYVTGQTTSADFPGAGVAPGGQSDAWIVKMHTDGTSRDASRYLGGAGYDAANAIAIDSSGNVYVGGKSNSMPTTVGSAQKDLPSGAVSNGFVAKLDSALAGITWATYIGGGATNKAATGDQAEVLGVALDSLNNVYAVGDTQSIDMTTVNAPQTANGGAPAGSTGLDAFAAKLKADGSAFVYATYLGGMDDGSLFTGERAQGVATGPGFGFNAYVAGVTFSSDFPTVSPYQSSINGTGTGNGVPDAFILKLVPAPATIDSGPSGPTASTSAQFAFSSTDSGGTLKCSIDVGGDPSSTCSSPKNYTSLAQGPHTFRAEAFDSGGATSFVIASQTFTVDTVDPTTPGPTAPADGALVATFTPTFSWTASSDPAPGTGIDHYELSVDSFGPANVSPGVCSAGTCTTPPPYGYEQGPHTWTVRAVDAAGHASADSATRSFTVDTQHPTAPAPAAPADGAAVPSTSPTFSWSTSTDPAPGTGIDHYELWIDGAKDQDVAAGGCMGGACAVPPVTPLGQGPHTWFVRGVDGAGNSTDGPTRALTVDTQAPTAPILTSPAEGAPGVSFTPSFTWNASSDPAPGSGMARYELWIDNVKNHDVPLSACSGGVCSATPSSALPEGTHGWWVVAVDGAGLGVASEQRHFTSSSPPTALLVIAPNPVLVGKDVTFDGSQSGAGGGTITDYAWDLDGDGSLETDTGANPQAVRTYATPGDVTVRLRVTTVTGQTATTSGVVHVTAQQGPPGQFGVSVNNGAQYTNSPDVIVTCVFPSTTTALLFSNDGGFFAPTQFAAVRDTHWHLDSSGPERLPKIVYVRFLTGPLVSETHTDDIILDERPPTVEQATLVAAAGASIAKLRSWRLKLKATDTNSGVDKVQVTASKRKPGKLIAYKRKLTVKSATRPKFVRARDRAGNLSPWRRVK